MEETRNSDAMIITRELDAPIELVWKAWTDANEMMKWWGPKDFTSPVIKSDLRIGGKYHWCMHGATEPGVEKKDFWTTGRFKEIVPMKKLVYTDNFADAGGNKVSASTYGITGDWPESVVTTTLEDFDGKTIMTVTHVGLPVGKLREMTRVGWNQSFDKLQESLTLH